MQKTKIGCEDHKVGARVVCKPLGYCKTMEGLIVGEVISNSSNTCRIKILYPKQPEDVQETDANYSTMRILCQADEIWPDETNEETLCRIIIAILLREFQMRGIVCESCNEDNEES